MAENWDVYLCSVDDQPAIIYLDLGQLETAPEVKRPWLLRVTIPLRHPEDDGMSGESEADLLYEIEDELFECVAKGLKARYVGRVTTQGRRDFFFYARSAEGFEEAVTQALAEFPDYSFELEDRDDSEWDVYTNLLYPSDLDLQGIETRQVLESMEQNGIDLTVPRTVEHLVSFPSHEARTAFVEQVQPEGFECEEAELDDEIGMEFPYGLRIKRQDRLELQTFDPLVADLFIRADDCGGSYDGWEAEMPSEDE